MDTLLDLALGPFFRIALLLLLLGLLWHVGFCAWRGTGERKDVLWWSVAAVLLVGAGDLESVLYLVEVVLGIMLPLALFAWPRTRRSLRGLGVAAGFCVGGLVLNRLDVGLLGYLSSAGGSYLPTVAELAICFGIPAGAGLIFFALVERFRFYSEGGPPAPLDPPPATERSVRFQLRPAAARLSRIFVITLAVAIGLFTANSGEARSPEGGVHPPVILDSAAGIYRIDGDRDGDAVDFPHDLHGEFIDCRSCHHMNAVDDEPVTCSRCHSRLHDHAPLFQHGRHLETVGEWRGLTGPRAGNQTCSLCHDSGEPRAKVDPGVCTRCHREPGWEDTSGKVETRGYTHALHDLCIRCHGERQEGTIRRTMGNCSVCHQ